jgi:hypothetical protein
LRVKSIRLARTSGVQVQGRKRGRLSRQLRISTDRAHLVDRHGLVDLAARRSRSARLRAA